jgi:drug/metabolite transporter (DMT)-like permease
MVLASLALLASAFLHAFWNALLKREADPGTAVAGVLAAAVAFAVGAAAVGSAPAFATRAALAWASGAGLCEGLYFVTLAAALSRAAYGAVYAVARGGAMLAVWPASAWLLGEGVTARGLAGATLVAVGLALVAAAGGTRGSRAGFAYAAACAASIAGYHLCYDRALARGARAAPLFAVALAVALPLVGAAAWRGARAPLRWPDRRAALRWTLAGAITTVSFLLFLWGLARTGAAVALTLRNSSIAFAQVLALLIGERVSLRQLAGAALVMIGVTMAAPA